MISKEPARNNETRVPITRLTEALALVRTAELEVQRTAELLETDLLIAAAPVPPGLSTRKRLQVSEVAARGLEAEAHTLHADLQSLSSSLERLSWLADKLGLYWRLETSGQPENETDRQEWEAFRNPEPQA